MTRKPSRFIDTYAAWREIDRRAIALIYAGADIKTAYMQALNEKTSVR